MPVLMKAANMICAVLRNGERLAAAAREGGDGRGDRGHHGSNGVGRGGGGGGDRHRGGPAQYNPAGPPMSAQAPPSAAPVNYPYQQQAPPVRVFSVFFLQSCLFGLRLFVEVESV